MKVLFLLLGLLAAPTFSEAATEPIEVVFTSEMTREAITKLRTDLAVQGVRLDIIEAVYSDAGNLKGLKFQVEAGGFSGSAGIGELPGDKPFGFRYAPGTDIPLTVGYLIK